jgi:hypothetical protein
MLGLPLISGFVFGVSVNIEVFEVNAELTQLGFSSQAITAPVGAIHTGHWHIPPSQQGWM